MSAANKSYKRVTTKTLVEMKANGEKIAMLTAYDYTMAKIVDHAGIENTLWENRGSTFHYRKISRCRRVVRLFLRRFY